MSLAFSPDGRRLATAGRAPLLVVWDVTARPARRAQALAGHEGTVFDLAFSPDGKRVATASRDGTVRIWDLETEIGRVLRGHVGAVKRVAFSPDGASLASGGEDGTVRLWEVGGDALAPRDAAGLRAWLDALTSARIDDAGRVASPARQSGIGSLR